MTPQNPTEQLPGWLLRLLTAIYVILALSMVLAMASLASPWIDNPGYWSFGPPLTIVVLVACVVATALVGNIGPRVRSSERAAYRARVEVARARGLSGKRAFAAARIPFPARVRAGRAVGGGVVAAVGGVLERWLVSYNLDSIDSRGLEPGIGVDLGNTLTVMLFVCAVAAIAAGIAGMTVSPVRQPSLVGAPAWPATGFATSLVAPAMTTPTAATWAPTHRAPDDGMPSFETPVPGVPIAMLDPRLPLSITERLGAWAHVRAENGWEGWVDGDRLVALVPPAVSPRIPPMPVG